MEKGKLPSQVYLIFEGSADGDGRLHWNLNAVAASIKAAKEQIALYGDDKVYDPIHPGMNISNNYTLVTDRQSCNIEYNPEEHNFPSEVGGYIIEAHTLIQ